MLLLHSKAHLALHLQAVLLADLLAVVQDLLVPQVPGEVWAGFATVGDAGGRDLRSGWFGLSLSLRLISRDGQRYRGWGS